MIWSIAFSIFCTQIATVYGATVLAKGFDAFLFQPVTANVTCGKPAEQYFNTKEGYVAPRLRVLSVCDSSNPLFSRPATYMTDGNITTSWQSTNNIDKAYITVNLRQPMYGKQLIFKFGDYRRPGQIAIYKSSDFGQTYQPWHYMVSHRQECTKIFGIPDNEIHILPDENANRVLCQEYEGYPFEYGEEVLIDLNGMIRGDGSNFFESRELLQWMNVTNVHIRFSGLYRKFDYIDTRWHHYVVSEVSLIARCDCNGHGDGISCPLNTATGSRRCTCNDNTCGDHCEKCCAAFNQYPWQRGSRASWISDNTTACERCNCLGHSDECRYDSLVAQQQLSMDIFGNNKGGGVCINCLHNTDGINCEKCKPFYYRPPFADPKSINACPACGCSTAGTRPAFGNVKYLECVKDNEMADFFTGMKVGDCFCKDSVVGSKCNVCKDQFYRLEASNPRGCRPCGCFLPGTVQRLNVCHKDFFGQCPCKSNVKQRDCSICKDGYYDLRNDDSDGCKWCDCDVGASISPYICNKRTGVCTCRAHIKGRRCKDVEPGYYYPDMYHICGQRNLYLAPKSALKTTIEIPQDALYKLYIQYKLGITVEPTVTLRLKADGSDQLLFMPNLPTAAPLFCSSYCVAPFEQDEGNNVHYFLNAGLYHVEVTASLSNSQFFLEKLIAIPVEYITAAILLDSDKNDFLSNCDVVNNNMSIGTENEALCLAGAYSMTVKFQDGALPCECNPIGSMSLSCQKFGGKCQCREGIGGRDCSVCLPTFYNFSVAGCQPCDCKGANKICNSLTGMCNCPPNTQGRVCDRCQCNSNSNKCNRDGICSRCEFNTEGDNCEKCQDGFYGDALKSQCTACNCHILGAFNKSCDVSSGQCYCRPGVVGRTCSQCDANYYGLSIRGCTACNCNEFGSSSLQCSNTGQCPCLTSVGGEKCEKCKSGFYGLPTMTCQACECNTTGSVLNTNCINDEFGQCACKIGVQGRACDQCKKQYAEFGINGCKQCPLCTRKLQGHADEVADSLINVQGDINITESLIDLQTNLKDTQNRLQQVELNAALFEYRLKQGQVDYTQLHQQKLIPWNTHLTKLVSQINMVSMQAKALESLGEASEYKMAVYYKAAESAALISDKVDVSASMTFTQLVNLNSLATKIVGMAYSYVQNAPSFNFNAFEATIDADLSASNKMLGNVTDIFKEVSYQETISKAYAMQMDMTENYFQTKEREWALNSAAFLEKINDVYKKGQDVVILLNETKKLIDAQEGFIDSTSDEQDIIQDIILASDKLYVETLSLYEENKLHTQSVTGGIEIMFLQYSRDNSILRVNVLRGYHLVPRDIPFLKSDPYFQLSISPRWFNQGPLESAPKYGTLDPTWDWPVGGVYTFFITFEQMKETKLIITVYDQDSNGPDEFMGEVVINLNEMLPFIQQGVSQNTYEMKPQGFESRWNEVFKGPGENGLLDLQNMLKSQIDTVEKILLQTNAAHSKAEINANQLLAEAQLLSSTFDQAKRYASKAVNAVNAYNEVYRLINSSLNGAIAVNSSVQEITQILSGISVNSFTSQTNAELLAAQQFVGEVTERNVSFSYLNIQLRSETYGNPGIRNPPRSSILINGFEYHTNLNGHTVVLIDYKTGRIDQVRNFRTDYEKQASYDYQMFLQSIASGKVIIIVKQAEGVIHTDYQNNVMSRLLEIGGSAPFFSGRRGAYILLGYKRERNEAIPWISQVARNEGAGIAVLTRLIQLEATLHRLLHTANLTFYNALPQWSEIDLIFPKLKTSVGVLLQESAAASVVQAALEAANVIISQAITSANQVLRETQNLLINVNDLTDKYNYLLSASSNITNVIANGQSIANQAEERLKFQSNNLLQANGIKDSFSNINLEMDEKLNQMKDKINNLQKITTEFPFTARFDQNAYSIYTLKRDGNAAIQTVFDIIQFDVKPSSLDGVLWALLSSPDSKSNSMAIFMKEGYIYYSFNLGLQDIIGRCLMKLKVDQWYRVHVSRIGKAAFLVVRDPIGFTSNARISSPLSNERTMMTFDGKSRWYLNGFPQGIMDTYTQLYGRFAGIFDNFMINGYTYNLFDSQHLSGSIAYANYRYKLPPKTDGNSVTLFGNGFIRHKVGLFAVNNDQSKVELEFRTLKDNVVIFGVTGQSGSFIYGLYNFGGKLMFQFATGLGNNIAIITDRNLYNNGEWYRVTVSRSGSNATLNVLPLKQENQYLAETKTDFIGVTTIPVGTTIVFGAASSSSPIPPPVSGSFAGDLRNVRVLENGVLTARKFMAFKNFIEQKGESYYDMIPGMITHGIRFYGYMWWRRTGSYAMLNAFESVNVNSVYLSFKTSQLSGIIFYKPGGSAEMAFYMALMAGNLVIILQNPNTLNTITPFVTKNLTLSDGQWHNMSVAYTQTGFQVQVDTSIVYRGWFGNSASSMIGRGVVYVGGVPPNVNTFSTTQQSLRMDVESFLINRMEQNFLSSMANGVSYAGIAPGSDMVLPPPSCAAIFPDLVYEADPLQVRFGKAPWSNVQSYVGFRLSNAVLEKYFKSSFVITMSFRASVGDGIVFYIANSETNPTQYVSLEIIDGRLRYEFFNGEGKVTIETGETSKYATHGKWYKVYLLRIYQFGAMLIPETMEYKNARHSDVVIPMELSTPLYIGGLPENVNAPHFLNRKFGFNGCLRKFEISSGFETHAIDFTQPDLGGSITGTTACYSNVEPGAYFNGLDSWLYYTDRFELKNDFTLEFQFRTYKRSGVIFYLFSHQTPNGVAPNAQYGTYALLEMNDGKMEFHYKPSLFQPAQIFEWVDPQKKDEKSYYLCDQKWHSVKVVKTQSSLSIQIDNSMTLGGGIVNDKNQGVIIGHVYLGGLRGQTEKPGIESRFFDGCLKIRTIGEPEAKLHECKDGNNIIFACPTF